MRAFSIISGSVISAKSGCPSREAVVPAPGSRGTILTNYSTIQAVDPKLSWGWRGGCGLNAVRLLNVPVMYRASNPTSWATRADIPSYTPGAMIGPLVQTSARRALRCCAVVRGDIIEEVQGVRRCVCVYVCVWSANVEFNCAIYRLYTLPAGPNHRMESSPHNVPMLR